MKLLTFGYFFDKMKRKDRMFLFIWWILSKRRHFHGILEKVRIDREEASGTDSLYFVVADWTCDSAVISVDRTALSGGLREMEPGSVPET